MTMITATTMITMTTMIMEMMMPLTVMMVIHWNPALQTPSYKGQFRLSRRKGRMFSLIWTTDTFLRPESQTLTYISSTYPVYNGHWLTAHFLFSCQSQSLPDILYLN